MITILVLDDDQTFTGLLKTVFELEGYRPVSATSPHEVMRLARDVRPALVLMDVHTGDGDTFETLRNLKADADLGSVPVVMTSGMDHKEECLQAGAAVFLFKPFRPSELLGLVAKLVGGQELSND